MPESYRSQIYHQNFAPFTRLVRAGGVFWLLWGVCLLCCSLSLTFPFDPAIYWDYQCFGWCVGWVSGWLFWWGGSVVGVVVLVDWSSLFLHLDAQCLRRDAATSTKAKWSWPNGINSFTCYCNVAQNKTKKKNVRRIISTPSHLRQKQFPTCRKMNSAKWIRRKSTLKNACMQGPARELCDVVFFPVSQASGLHLVHHTWAGTFVLAALCLVFLVSTLCSLIATVYLSRFLKLKICGKKHSVCSIEGFQVQFQPAVGLGAWTHQLFSLGHNWHRL